MAPAKQLSTREGAFTYLRLVQKTLKHDEGKYREFVLIIQQFQTKSIDVATVVSLFKSLFKAHPHLLLEEFLPKGHYIQDPQPELMVVSLCSGKGVLKPSVQPAGQEDEAETPSNSKDLQQALNFVNKVKQLDKEEHVFPEVLRVLRLYKEGLDVEEVTRRISSLLAGHGELVEEFAGFLPQCRCSGSLPACSLQQIIQANFGLHDNAKRMPGKESGKSH